MVSSFGISVVFLILNKQRRDPRHCTRQLLITVVFTTVCWLATAYLGPRTDASTLVGFYSKVRPIGPGWQSIRALAGISEAEVAADARAAPTSHWPWRAGPRAAP